ncbi:MAG: nucleoside triphosphate pyrophosphohydrolase [Planctomycetes bacterium]|nr:nucleoside triphosphate pyrophosphohydrolase [Planctomycetota bacterium]
MSDERIVKAATALAEVMRRLRRDCPWDRRQSHESLRRYLVEECHEVLDALDRGDRVALRAELGDLLFQIWFHAEVASEHPEEPYGLAEIIEDLSAKLIRRHPHVYGDRRETEVETLRADWERMKMQEGRRSRLEGLPPLLPALQAALVLQDKAARVGFDWPALGPVLDKVREELAEFLAELPEESTAIEAPAALRAEYGDLLFALVNVGRWLRINPEDALRETNLKFRRRFHHVEERARAAGLPLEEAGLERMDAWWDEAKRNEAAGDD